MQHKFLPICIKIAGFRIFYTSTWRYPRTYVNEGRKNYREKIKKFKKSENFSTLSEGYPPHMSIIRLKSRSFTTSLNSHRTSERRQWRRSFYHHGRGKKYAFFDVINDFNHPDTQSQGTEVGGGGGELLNRSPTPYASKHKDLRFILCSFY